MTGCKIGKVIPKLRVVENFPIRNEGLIEAMEAALERAKRGDITAGMWVFITKEGGRFTGNSHKGGLNYFYLLGALEESKCHLMDIAKSIPQE